MSDALKKYQDLLDAGLITEEDFEAKKQQLQAEEASAEEIPEVEAEVVSPERTAAAPRQPKAAPAQPTPAPAQPVSDSQQGSIPYEPVQPQGFQTNSFQPQGYQSSGYQTNGQQSYQQNPMPGYTPVKSSKSKVVAGVLGILLGSLGIHKFYLGYTKEGLIMLLVSIIGSFLGLAFIMSIIGFVEGILYLVKSDADFNRVYVQGHKGWL